MTGLRNISKAMLLGILLCVRQQLKGTCDREIERQNRSPKVGVQEGTGRMSMALVVKKEFCP